MTRLSLLIALLFAVVSLGGVLIDDLYRDNDSMMAQAAGQDPYDLVLVVPAFVASTLLAARGSRRASVIELGLLIYVTYNSALYTFDIRFNEFFLIYVAMLGCSFYALIGKLVTTRWADYVTPAAPIKTVSSFMMIFAILFYLVWLMDVIPALLNGETPRGVIDSGTPTSGVHVLDMGLILPALLITARALRRHTPWAYAMAGALLVFLLTEVGCIMAMVVAMKARGTIDSLAQLAMFGVIAAITLAVNARYLRHEPQFA